MRSLVLLLAFAACGKPSKQAPSGQEAPKSGSADGSNTAMMLNEPEAPIPKRVPREAALPARTGACQAKCDVASDPRAKEDCAETAPGIIGRGFMEHVACHPTEVIIDCCAALPTENLSAITDKLGWKAAAPTQREAIAWAVVRIAMMARLEETAREDFTPHDSFAPPRAERRGDDLLLTYWTLVPLRKQYLEHLVTFHADGSVTQADGRTAEEKSDPELERKQALEAAKKAGLLEEPKK